MHRFRSSVAALFLSASVSLAAGCSGSTPQHTTPAPETTTSAVTESPAETTVQTTTAVTTTVDVTETTQEANVTIGAGEEHDDRSLSSVLMKVSGTDGKMKVTRSALKNTSMGEKDTWTIFVYLCGTDLESNGGAATNDVVQMQDGALGEDVKFVIQTGGTSQWRNDIFDSEKSERYVIHNGLSSLVYSDELKNMGDPNTLADFLSWGVKEYPADKMGVILWDHGGGSIYGLCQDEVQDEDTLYLSEINSAFSEVSRNMTDKFEFIGFDACIMETVEMANILASYSRYMYGSQEMMPGTGLDYEALGKYLQRNPGANGA
ncbi:MAG: hypothetical protein IK093_01905, partial [Ruminiclostridium sp.]|nr:hypothetical protein [Ruminiclostridium sp.]